MRKTLATIAALSLLALSACTSSDADAKPTVKIAVDPSDDEQMVLAEIYRQIAQFDGRQVGIIPMSLPDDSAKLSVLQSGEANFAVLCAGSLVTQENPGEAAELNRVAADAAGAGESHNAEDIPLATYDAAVATLPANLSTIDPSPAESCESQEHGDLPNNVIPVFDASLFDRGVRRAMNKATRAMTTEDLKDIVEEAAKDPDPSRAVNEWIQEKTGMGIALERAVEDDEPGGA